VLYIPLLVNFDLRCVYRAVIILGLFSASEERLFLNSE